VQNGPSQEHLQDRSGHGRYGPHGTSVPYQRTVAAAIVATARRAIFPRLSRSAPRPHRNPVWRPAPCKNWREGCPLNQMRLSRQEKRRSSGSLLLSQRPPRALRRSRADRWSGATWARIPEHRAPLTRPPWAAAAACDWRRTPGVAHTLEGADTIVGISTQLSLAGLDDFPHSNIPTASHPA
jgi:hypothetical protein